MPVIHFETDEPGQLAELAARAGWELRCIQSEPGGFRGACDIATFPELRICLGNFSPALRIHGQVPEGWRAVTMADAGASFRGRTLGNGSLCYIAPGDPAFWQTPGDHAADTVMVEAATLDRAVRAAVGRSLAETMPHTAVLAISPEYLGPLRRLLRALVSEAARPGSEGSCEILSGALVRSLAALLSGPEAGQRHAVHPNPEACHVAAALVLIGENLHRTVSLHELCQSTAVCPRTLQTSFVHQTGVGPTRFAREFRLHRVRTRLRGACRRTDSVKQIAIEHGFRHLGHFSHDYSVLFGELPSETLCRE
ncbi:helix-turn-helix domain-containing protein [Luteolibacter sp. Populi]|uniref:helix-turn-helix domain-containing protein n=1 Tax=Luteolibacter sp. Populi TaxID=3230487 RepID=UPI003465B0DB